MKPSKKQAKPNKSHEKKTKKHKKQRYESLIKDKPDSPYSCPTHPESYLKLLPKHPNNKTPPTCKSCGCRLYGKSGYFSCAKSASCYYLCSVCHVCPSNHIMRNVLALPQPQDSTQDKGKFNCMGCKQDKIVDSVKGVYHCPTCVVSICRECIEKTEALWIGDEDDDS